MTRTARFDRPTLSPWEPIFDVKMRRGQIDTGTTPGSAYVPIG